MVTEKKGQSHLTILGFTALAIKMFKNELW